MTVANNLDQDEAPQNVGPQMRSKLLDDHITYYRQNFGWNITFILSFVLQILKQFIFLLSLQRVKLNPTRDNSTVTEIGSNKCQL